MKRIKLPDNTRVIESSIRESKRASELITQSEDCHELVESVLIEVLKYLEDCDPDYTKFLIYKNFGIRESK